MQIHISKYTRILVYGICGMQLCAALILVTILALLLLLCYLVVVSVLLFKCAGVDIHVDSTNMFLVLLLLLLLLCCCWFLFLLLSCRCDVDVDADANADVDIAAPKTFQTLIAPTKTATRQLNGHGSAHSRAIKANASCRLCWPTRRLPLTVGRLIVNWHRRVGSVGNAVAVAITQWEEQQQTPPTLPSQRPVGQSVRHFVSHSVTPDGYCVLASAGLALQLAATTEAGNTWALAVSSSNSILPNSLCCCCYWRLPLLLLPLNRYVAKFGCKLCCFDFLLPRL